MKFKKVDWFWAAIAVVCLSFGNSNGSEPQSFIFYSGVLITVMAGVFLILQGIASTVQGVGNMIYRSMPTANQKSYQDFAKSRGRIPMFEEK